MASSVADSGFRLQPDYVNPALAADSTFTTMFKTAPPKDLLYNDILMAPAASRLWDEQLADNGTQYRPVNQKFSVTINRRNILDFSQATLTFGASCSTTEAQDVHFTQGIWNLFSRIRITSGSVVIMDQLDKNVFESFNYAFSRSGNYDTTIGSIQGIGSVAQRIAWGKLDAGTNYAIPLNIPLLTSEEMAMMNTQGFVIEFYMAPATSCVCKTAGGSPAAGVDYIITNPKIRFHGVEYQPDLQRPIARLPIIAYPYINYKSFTTQIPTGTTKFMYSIPIKVQSLIRMIAFMRPTARINSPSFADVLTTDFQYNNTNEYYLKIDNQHYPPAPIAAGGQQGYQQAYLECLACMNKAELARLNKPSESNNGTCAWKSFDRFLPSGDDFVDNRFAMCLDLKATIDNDPNYLQRFDVTPGNVQLLLNVNFNGSGPTEPQTLYIFMVHSSIAMGDINGKWTLIE